MNSRLPIPGRRPAFLIVSSLVALLALGAAPLLALDDVLEDERNPGDGPALMAGADAADDFAGPGGDRFGDRLARRLDLSEAQRAAVAKIHEAGRARDLPLRKQLRLLKHELEGELLKDAPAEKTALALVERIGDLRTALQAGRLRDRLAVRAQLTDEQRDRLALMGPRGDGPGGRRGFGRHGGRGGPGFAGPGCDGSGPGRGGDPAPGPRPWQPRNAD